MLASATVAGMRALWHGQVLADSERTLEVDGYVYFPRDAVRMELLRAAPKTDGDRACPHGVQFYDVVDGPRRGERQAWSYEKPGPRMRAVDQWLGFWDEVEVVAS
jgi:uncharacterized protein (DUF427 family)